jgi:hypothetical protein
MSEILLLRISRTRFTAKAKKAYKKGNLRKYVLMKNTLLRKDLSSSNQPEDAFTDENDFDYPAAKVARTSVKMPEDNFVRDEFYYLVYVTEEVQNLVRAKYVGGDFVDTIGGHHRHNAIFEIHGTQRTFGPEDFDTERVFVVACEECF